MFSSAKRQAKAKQATRGATSRLSDAILKNTDQGFFLLTGSDKIEPQVSLALTLLFRRQDFADLTFEKLLAPIVSAKTLSIARSYIAALLAGASSELQDANTLQNVDVRLLNADGTTENAQYCFWFHAIENGHEDRVWLVRVSDITGQVLAQRELDELRVHVLTEGEILRAVLRIGGARFAQFLQKADASMKNINTVLKKSARAEDAFRNKLEETLDEVDGLRREAAACKLSALEESARVFEDALQELRGRPALSGSDFLPLAVKLDHLFSQLMLIRSLSQPTSIPYSDAAGTEQKGAKSTQPLDAERSATDSDVKPAYLANTATVQAALTTAPPSAPSGSLEHTLLALTEHIANEQHKRVVLEANGLLDVPPAYQAAVKNVAIQLIRNAVMHGIESPIARASAGKPPHGTLRLEFKVDDGGFEFAFEDDGCGLNPDKMRATAIERQLITTEAAARMRDREAIKLIFKSGFTTLAASPTDRTHGAGMALVRRYIHEAGGKIALASLDGHETRFKITLPPSAKGNGAVAPRARASGTTAWVA